MLLALVRKKSIIFLNQEGTKHWHLKLSFQALGPGALGRARGIGLRGRWEGGSGWGILANPWLIHVNV